MSLIDQLVKEHTKRPWWKEFLRPVWFLSIILWYLALSFMGGGVDYHSLPLLSGIIMGLAVASFSYYCSLHQKHVPRFLPLLSFLFLAAGLIVDKSFHSGRGFAPQEIDFICFQHACLFSLGPVLLFPAIDRQFFIAEKRLHNISILFTLAFSGLMMIELKCSNLDFEHIVLGHITSLGGIVGLGVMTIIFWKKFLARPSSLGEGKL